MARESVDSEEKEKKAPRKRVSRTTPKVAILTEAESTTPRRKAPTTVTSSSSAKSYKGIYIPAIILLLGLGAAIAIGFSDKGQISVVGVVNERNARVSSGETIEGESTATSNTIVPVQNVGQGLVDGGLQGTGSPDPVPTPVVETATSTATSTEAQATSTEETNTPDTEPESEGSEVEGEVTTE